MRGLLQLTVLAIYRTTPISSTLMCWSGMLLPASLSTRKEVRPGIYLLLYHLD